MSIMVMLLLDEFTCSDSTFGKSSISYAYFSYLIRVIGHTLLLADAYSCMRAITHSKFDVIFIGGTDTRSHIPKCCICPIFFKVGLLFFGYTVSQLCNLWPCDKASCSCNC